MDVDNDRNDPDFAAMMQSLQKASDSSARTEEECRPDRDRTQTSRRSADHSLAPPTFIPPRFRNSTLDTYELYAGEMQRNVLRICRTYAAHIRDFPPGSRDCLLFAGGSGTGKSHLSFAIGQHLVQGGIEPTVRTLPHIMREASVNSAHPRWRDEQTIIDEAIDAEFLILEEIGLRSGVANEHLVLFDIIDGRYLMQRPSIYTTAMDLDDFHDFTNFDGYDRIWSRLRETATMLELGWPSYANRGVAA